MITTQHQACLSSRLLVTPRVIKFIQVIMGEIKDEL